ncbi:MAG TPA: HIT family protein, partial [Microthrixaceae bacterium]|nr:HIT family protein [Microthrixaceae bacterium]
AIVAGTEPAAVVLEDDSCVAFLDQRPLFEGHVLVVPREHHETLMDLPLDQVGSLFERVRALEAAIESAMGAQGTFVAINNRVSQSVPHLHVHVVPRTKGDGLKGFFWPRTRYRDESRVDEVRAAIAAAYQHRGDETPR